MAVALPMDRDLDPAIGIAHVRWVDVWEFQICEVPFFTHAPRACVGRKEGGEGRKGGPGFSAQGKDKGKEGTWKREGKKNLGWSLPWRIRARSIIL